MKLTNRELANLIKANPGRWPELEGGNTTEEPPRRGSAEQVGSCENHNITQDPNMIEHAAALSTAVVYRAGSTRL
jgi:hypothetical protein